MAHLETAIALVYPQTLQEPTRVGANSTRITRCSGAATPRDLPAPADLQNALKTQLRGVLLFSVTLSADEKTRCVETIRAALPDARVNAINPDYGFDRIGFQRILEREEILSNAAELGESAREFRALATELCGRLAAKIGVSATELSRCGQYLPPEKRGAQSGELDANWKYFFHGFQCAFTHRHSGQNVDVEFGFEDEFGVLDPWFWQHFLQTTPRFASLGRWLALDFSDAKRVSNVLHETGYLVEITSTLIASGQSSGWTRRGLVAAPQQQSYRSFTVALAP